MGLGRKNTILKRFRRRSSASSISCSYDPNRMGLGVSSWTSRDSTNFLSCISLRWTRLRLFVIRFPRTRVRPVFTFPTLFIISRSTEIIKNFLPFRSGDVDFSIVPVRLDSALFRRSSRSCVFQLRSTLGRPGTVLSSSISTIGCSSLRRATVRLRSRTCLFSCVFA